MAKTTPNNVGASAPRRSGLGSGGSASLRPRISQQVGFDCVRSPPRHRGDALVCLRRPHQRIPCVRNLEVAYPLGGDCRRSVLLLAVAFTSRVLSVRFRTVLIRCGRGAVLHRLVLSQVCVGKSRILCLDMRFSERCHRAAVPIDAPRGRRPLTLGRYASFFLQLMSINNIRPILWANVSWEHTGRHSGMAPLSREVEALIPGRVQRVAPKRNQPQRLKNLPNKFRRLAGMPPKPLAWEIVERGEMPFYGEKPWLLEQNISKIAAQRASNIILLEAIEEQLFPLAGKKKQWPGTRFVGICHQPPAWWKLNYPRPEVLGSLDALVVVASTSKAYWEQVNPKQRVVMIPHGADIEFFCPSASEAKLSAQDGWLRALFCGQWLRDFDTLAAVVEMADKLELPVRFELVVPRFARSSPACYRIAMSPRVRWHAGLSDEELLRLYRQSDLLLLPLTDSTANNGLLEGMSCGLPAIVTDVGGVRDYANEAFADFVPRRDPAAMIECLKDCLAHKEKLAARGAAARAHVEKHLSWKKVAQQYVELFQSL